MRKNIIFSLLLLMISITLAIGGAELILRIKNSSMKNYDIEMWRYAKELKTASNDPHLGHEHVPNREATLQSVKIRLNEWGLRGPPLPSSSAPRRILFLGGSITLGWGVAEENTVTARLQAMFRAANQDVEVLNAGVGNYNAERYVELFFTKLKKLNPTDIVVQYFLRDAEQLDPGGGNAILRNSELAVTMWIAGERLLHRTGNKALIDHYREVYREDQPGYIEMKKRLKELADYARTHNIRLYMAMTPDVHNLKNYQFGFVHERMQQIAAQNGFRFIDLLPALESLAPEKIWAMPGDPHPNALGHELMAKTIFPALLEQK